MKKLLVTSVFILLEIAIYGQIIRYSETVFDEDSTEYLVKLVRRSTNTNILVVDKVGDWSVDLNRSADKKNHSFDQVLFDDNFIYIGGHGNVIHKINKITGQTVSNRLGRNGNGVPSTDDIKTKWINENLIFSITIDDKDEINAHILDKDLNHCRMRYLPFERVKAETVEILNCNDEFFVFVARSNGLFVLDHNLEDVIDLDYVEEDFSVHSNMGQRIELFDCEAIQNIVKIETCDSVYNYNGEILTSDKFILEHDLDSNVIVTFIDLDRELEQIFIESQVCLEDSIMIFGEYYSIEDSDNESKVRVETQLSCDLEEVHEASFIEVPRIQKTICNRDPIYYLDTVFYFTRTDDHLSQSFFYSGSLSCQHSLVVELVSGNREINIDLCGSLADTINYKDTFFINSIDQEAPFFFPDRLKFKYGIGDRECDSMSINYTFSSRFDTTYHSYTPCRDAKIEYGLENYTIAKDTSFYILDSIDCFLYHLYVVEGLQYDTLRKDTVIDLGGVFQGQNVLNDLVILDSSLRNDCQITEYSVFANYNEWTIAGDNEFVINDHSSIITLDENRNIKGFINDSLLWSVKIPVFDTIMDKASNVKLNDNGYAYYLNNEHEIVTVGFPLGGSISSGEIVDFGTVDEYLTYDFIYNDTQYIGLNTWIDLIINNDISDSRHYHYRVFDRNGDIVSNSSCFEFFDDIIYEIESFDNGSYLIYDPLCSPFAGTIVNDSLIRIGLTYPSSAHYLDNSTNTYLHGNSHSLERIDTELDTRLSTSLPSNVFNGDNKMFVSDSLIFFIGKETHMYDLNLEYKGNILLDRIEDITKIKLTDDGHILIGGTKGEKEFILKEIWNPTFYVLLDSLTSPINIGGITYDKDTIIEIEEDFILGKNIVSYELIFMDLDLDGFNVLVDCDDSDPSINPGQNEVPYDGINNDCNEATYDDDLDQDGFNVLTDCDDLDPEINPSATDIPNNQVDEDCDGVLQITNTIEEIFEVSMTPFPPHDLVEVEIIYSRVINSNPSKYYISMYNTQGQIVISEVTEERKISLDFNYIPSGLYYFRVIDIVQNKSQVTPLFLP